MKVRIDELGERAMNSLLAQMRGGTDLPAPQILAPSLVIRRSTAAHSNATKRQRQEEFAEQEGR
jgi:DNA-binding LacI/PurR family transcriptional regulator